MDDFIKKINMNKVHHNRESVYKKNPVENMNNEIKRLLKEGKRRNNVK